MHVLSIGAARWLRLWVCTGSEWSDDGMAYVDCEDCNAAKAEADAHLSFGQGDADTDTDKMEG